MLNKVCNILMVIVLTVLIIIAGLLLVPKIVGYETFAVISGSMEPKIPVGAIVYTKETSFENLNINDVISFDTNNGSRVTHRIIEVDTDNQQFITQGDANNVKDADPVAYQQVIGKVTLTIPLLGYLSMYIRTPLGVAGICAVIFILILLNYLPEILTKEDEVKEK